MYTFSTGCTHTVVILGLKGCDSKAGCRVLRGFEACPHSAILIVITTLTITFTMRVVSDTYVGGVENLGITNN